MSKKPDQYLPGKWLCCGGVRDYGTPEEVQKSIEFYLDYFSKIDVRGSLKEGDYKVIITKECFGNVAGRDGREIKEEDILKKYNF
jgi:hypothetical protein